MLSFLSITTFSASASLAPCTFSWLLFSVSQLVPRTFLWLFFRTSYLLPRTFPWLLLLTLYLVPRTSIAQTKHKVMLIPFEPKLYMSQIDHKINAETKMTQKQIRETFRKGVNKELESALKKNYGVVDLLKDTTKYKKDLIAIYKSLTYSYDKAPDQSNYKAPVNEKKNESIKKGQLVVETDPNARFMNAKITSAGMVPGLFAKYKTDLFLFVNQLDIISSTVGTGETGTLTERMITLHYTVYTIDAKEIQSGICSVKFSPEVNSPSKIISAYISKIAAEINRRLTIAVTKKEAAEKK